MNGESAGNPGSKMEAWTARMAVKEAKEQREQHFTPCPLDTRVLLRLVKPKERTASGNLIIPEVANEGLKILMGVVVAVGARVRGIVPGDIALFEKYQCLEVYVEGEALQVARGPDIERGGGNIIMVLEPKKESTEPT